MSSMYDASVDALFVMFYRLKIHASAGALIHRQQTIYWIFTQTKLSCIYRHKPTVIYWALITR